MPYVAKTFKLLFDSTLVVNRQYQRKLVWTPAEKQRLIDSILKDYPLPLFMLADKGSPSGEQSMLEIIDGMQRLNAIFSYIENGYLLTAAQRTSSYLELQTGLGKEGSDQMRLVSQAADREVELLM